MTPMIATVALAGAMVLAVAGTALAAQETAATTAKTAAAGSTTTTTSLRSLFRPLGNRVTVSGSTVTALSVKDCKAVGGRVETHDGCAKVGGNEVGLKCVIAGQHLCIDEASAR